MTPLVWVNFPLALAFILAIVGIPLWMTFKRPQTTPDHSQAHAYLAAKTALVTGTAPEAKHTWGAHPAASPSRALDHGGAQRSPAPARRRAEAVRQAAQHSA